MKTLQLIVIFTICNILQSYAQYTTVVLSNELEITDKELIKRIDPQLLRQIWKDNQALEVICDEIKSKDEYTLYVRLVFDLDVRLKAFKRDYYWGHAYLDGELILFWKSCKDLDIAVKKKKGKSARLRVPKDVILSTCGGYPTIWKFEYRNGKYKYIKKIELWLYS